MEFSYETHKKKAIATKLLYWLLKWKTKLKLKIKPLQIYRIIL